MLDSFIDSNNHQKEGNMARIEYSAISPASVEFINSDEFRAVLTAHPNLRLVTIGEEDEDGDELLVDVTLPLPEGHNEFVAVMDTDALMWVLQVSYCIVKDPSPAFVEVLKVMDAYSVKTLEERLFSREGQSAFDFANGDYVT
jgi:hypothetical protein